MSKCRRKTLSHEDLEAFLCDIGSEDGIFDQVEAESLQVIAPEQERDATSSCCFSSSSSSSSSLKLDSPCVNAVDENIPPNSDITDDESNIFS